MSEESIDYRINTEADTKGAEETTQALKDMRTEAQKLQAERDVEIAKAKQAAEAEAKQAAVLREIADGQQRIVAANLANALGKIGEQLKGINPDLDKSVEGIQNFLNVLASTGDPFLALGAVAASAFTIMKDAWVESDKIITEGMKQQEAAQKALTKAREEHAKTVREERLATVFQEEVEKLKQQVTLVERLNSLLDLQRKTEAKVEDSISPAKTPDDQVNRDRKRAIDDVYADIAKAEDAARDLAAIALKARHDAQIAARSAEADSELVKKTLAESEAAQSKAELAEAKAQRLREEAPEIIRAIDAAAVEGFKKVGIESTKNITTRANELIAEIQAVADANKGGDLAMKAALQSLVKLVQGGLDEAELKQFETALKLVQGSSTAIRTGLSQRLADDIELARQIEAANKTRNAETTALLKEMANNMTTFQNSLNDIRQQIRRNAVSGGN